MGLPARDHQHPVVGGDIRCGVIGRSLGEDLEGLRRERARGELLQAFGEALDPHAFSGRLLAGGEDRAGELLELLLGLLLADDRDRTRHVSDGHGDPALDLPLSALLLADLGREGPEAGAAHGLQQPGHLLAADPELHLAIPQAHAVAPDAAGRQQAGLRRPRDVDREVGRALLTGDPFVERGREGIGLAPPRLFALLFFAFFLRRARLFLCGQAGVGDGEREQARRNGERA